jgi:membrane-associated phospholipid phosphatase
MTKPDRSWSEAMQRTESESLERLAMLFDRAGRGAVRAGTLVAIGGALAYRRRWRSLAAFALAEAATPATINLIKVVVKRERPLIARVDPWGTSFPSGHASYAGATTVALVLLTSEPGSQRVPLWIVAAAGTTGMVWSRTYLQAHWLTDVIAGALIGCGVTLVVFALVDPN